jgi:hypothetical protein
MFSLLCACKVTERMEDPLTQAFTFMYILFGKTVLQAHEALKFRLGINFWPILSRRGDHCSSDLSAWFLAKRLRLVYYDVASHSGRCLDLPVQLPTCTPIVSNKEGRL